MKAFLLLGLLAVAPAWADAPNEPKPSDDAAAQFVAPGARIEKLAEGFRFVEGPAWNAGGYWVFSDIPADTLYKLTPDGQTSIYRKPSSQSNGNAYDHAGHLVSCEQDPQRRVARESVPGNWEALASRYDGKRFNSPNDLAIKSDGSIYFTDPSYGVKKEDIELPFRGLYRIFPDGKVELLDDNWAQPNGVCFSPDEATLYVNDSQAGQLFRYDVAKDGTLSNKTFMEIISKPGDPDGMKCDSAGRLFMTGPGGLWVFAPRGALLGKILTPQNPANLAFSGADGKTLLITARDALYSVRLQVAGAR